VSPTKRSILGVGIASALVALGCHAVGPDYERPVSGVSKEMPEVARVASSSSVHFTEEEPWTRWWGVFHDALLEKLVQDALDANQDLRAAMARVEISRSILRENFAPLMPTIGTLGAYQYVRIPPNFLGTNPNAPAGATPSSPVLQGQPFQVWAGVGTLSYEIDVWGRLRRALESSNADEVASEEDRKAVELTVIADTAQAYFDVGEASAELAIARDTVATREETLAIVKKRSETGFATELELRRAEGESAAARAVVPDAEAKKAIAEHRLAILTGRMPNLRFDGTPPAEFEVPPEIPVGVPAALLERRPDIRRAEAQLVGKNAKIGQAIAGFFPQFTIFGFAGYASIDLSKLAQPNSQIWAVGPIVRLPLFQGGLTYAQVLEAEARTSEAEAIYHETVLRAFGEVADSVVRIATDKRIRDEQTLQVAAVQRAVEVAQIQYAQGLALYLDVLDAQRNLLIARLALLRTQRQLLGDFIELEKALGGGWRELAPDEFQRDLVHPIVPEDKEGRRGASRE
jgi:multidrug efflux system outer membrane protein